MNETPNGNGTLSRTLLNALLGLFGVVLLSINAWTGERRLDRLDLDLRDVRSRLK